MGEAKHTPEPWKYGKRKDGSIWISFGDLMRGPHYQFDFYGSEADAKLVCSAPALLAALKRLLATTIQAELHALGCHCAFHEADAAIEKAEGAHQKSKAALLPTPPEPMDANPTLLRNAATSNLTDSDESRNHATEAE